MSASAPAPSEPHDPDGEAAWERTLLDRQLEALDRLAAMGMAIAGAIERRVTAEGADSEPVAALHHAAMDFARVSRAVRLTFALQSRLVADFKGRGRPRPHDNDDESGRDEGFEVVWLGQEEEEARKSEVVQIVKTVAQGAPDIERLEREAAERVEREEFYDILDRPIGQIVALICKDLGLEPDWDALAVQDWAQAEIAEGAPGSPFAAWMAERTSEPIDVRGPP